MARQLELNRKILDGLRSVPQTPEVLSQIAEGEWLTEWDEQLIEEIEAPTTPTSASTCGSEGKP
jgi:hypothetical protein